MTERRVAYPWLLLGVVLLAQIMVAAARWQIVIGGLGLFASGRQTARILLVGL